MILRRNEPLSSYTTLGLGGPASRFVVPTSEAELVEVLREARTTKEDVLLLGGGSNLVVSDAGFPGTVVKLGDALSETSIARDGDTSYVVTVAAGRSWDTFVSEMVNLGASGLESLSGIPGLVGATPMQNVGAYGQEVSQRIESVRVYDREKDDILTMTSSACGFGYRDSVFRGRTRFAILSVTFRLPRREECEPIRYEELARALDTTPGGTAPLRVVRRTVIALRRGKGMVVDPNDSESRSAGSFFKNPVLDTAAFQDLEARVERESPGLRVPCYPDTQGDPSRRKVSAAWLIERSGFRKGHGDRVRISKKHALSLVNGGNGTTEELVALARSICARVQERFRVTLEVEPILVGVSV
ncbi:MAG: UDP-N-acetylmuramate dehydrogenase [Polyangiaceae bacterium]